MYYITIILQIIGFYFIFCILCSMFSYLAAWFIVNRLIASANSVLGDNADTFIKYLVSQIDDSEVRDNITNSKFGWKDIIPSTVKEIREDSIINFFIETPVSAAIASLVLVSAIIDIIQINKKV